jgi:hypothetical protein
LVVARRSLAGVVLVGLSILSPAAAAKEFKPGDLRVCNASRCVSIRSEPALNALASFYYDIARPPARVQAPRLGTPFFELEFTNGDVTGIVAGTELNRFLSDGVNLDQFQQGVWYRVPTRAVTSLRRLTVGLTPLRLTAAAVMDTGGFDARSAAATQTRRQGRHPAPPSDGGSLPWALGIAPLAALIAVALLVRRRQRSAAGRLPAPGAR